MSCHPIVRSMVQIRALTCIASFEVQTQIPLQTCQNFSRLKQPHEDGTLAGLWEYLPQDNKFVVFPSFWDTGAASHFAHPQPAASTQWVSPGWNQRCLCNQYLHQQGLSCAQVTNLAATSTSSYGACN